MTPLVSIVIPTYNRERVLAAALASVRKQTWPTWEAIVIDNHSTDDTAGMLSRLADERIRPLAIHNHGVIAASRNLGLLHARGEYIAFLDSDDSWQPQKLEKAVHALEAGADVVYHDMNIVSSRRSAIGPRAFVTRRLTPPVHTDLLVNANTLPTSSVVARASVLREAGQFSEDNALIAGEDYDLWLRLALLTDRFARLDGVLGTLNRATDNQSSAHRLLSIANEIEQRYFANLSADERARAHANWMDYTRGVSQFKQQNYRDAMPYLVRVLNSSRSVRLRLRALYMLAAITVRRLGGVVA
jgi:glycosyltransferase involved in cell wall biosynthesis